MYEIERLPQSIDIGFTGEMDFRTVQIDMSEWVAKMPEGQPTLMHIRPGEYEAYPVEITFEDNIVTWSVSDEDLGTKEGTGLLQVWFGVQDETEVMRQLGMSAVVSTIIHLSLAGEGRNSSTVQIPWLKEVMEMKNIILGYDYEAESWSVGKRGGTDVPSTDPAYHNNAKYYSEQASAAKTAAEAAQEAAETAAERDVEAWLEENFTNPDSPPLDRTLALDTCAAPADMVGNLKSAIIDIESLNDNVALSWVTGGLANNGTENSNTNRIRTGFVDVSNSKSLKITIANGYQANVLRFHSDKTLIGASSWIGADMSITVTDLGYIRIAVKRNDDADMSTSEGSNIGIIRKTEMLAAFDAINEEINTVNSNVENVNNSIVQIHDDYYKPNFNSDNSVELSFNTSKYWDLSGTTATQGSNAAFQASSPISVMPGEWYRIYANSGGSLKVSSWAVVDSSYTILASGTKSSSQYVKTDDFKVPQGGKYLLITTMTGSTITSLIKGVLVPSANPIYGKTVAIIGDSISTNGNSGTDSNVPEIVIQSEDVGVQLSAYLTYYDVQAGLVLGGHTFTSDEIGTEVTFTPIADDVGKVIGLPNNYNENTVTTWWEVMQDMLNCTCIPNTWSGASVTSHEGNTEQYKTSYGWHPATIRKCGIRTPGTMTRTEPDLIIIYRGTNDFSHSPYALLTDNYFDNYNWEYPANDSVTGGYGYKEGLCLTIKKLRDAYPNAKIFLCTLNVFKRVNYSHFPTNNGINSLPQYNDAIREVADFMGCGVIDFDKDGITFENCYSQGYITDSSTIPTHPSDKGHKAMGLKAIADLKAQYSNMT